ncbi:MAG: type 2 lantipeptide synthetase LanM family protein [Aphanothece sp. CMT-3BRIN-NPC111]|jgi:type 2 lantibiotic biosynthesis protein LanM|nr:type 2 lantipeptide synthetase LanM family protein [Aphanothece sp. CMT-3BRIN-NPC111]
MIHSHLIQIVAQASFLYERLTNPLLEVDATQVNEQQAIGDRLNYWCQVVAQGNWEKFLARLQWDGWEVDTVLPVLGAVRLADSQTLPDWAETLREIIQTGSSFALHNEFQPPIDPENPQPFEDVLLPAVLVARQKLYQVAVGIFLDAKTVPVSYFLSESAYLTLERSLLKRLVDLCGETLSLEFSHFRPFGKNLLSLLKAETLDTPSKVHYQAFVQKLLQDGLLAFFQKYPVLGRLVATTIDCWVEATAEFLQRLKADLAEIEQVFAEAKPENPPLGKVAAIKASLSDPHHRDRTVIALTFESGLRLVYKPKNLGIEVAYQQLLEWCNQHSVPLAFKVLKVHNCGTHGWVEYVEQQPCEDEAAAQQFYQRAGILLCLLYALGGNDCHHENLIASGEHLVLIDMETLIHHEANPIPGSLEATAAETAVNEQFWDSVLRIGMLPRWEFNQGNPIARDVSGLGSIEPQPAARRMPRWKYINTDNMQLAYETVTMPVQGNVPILNGVALSPSDYLENLVSGFGEMYRFLIQQRSALRADDSPLTAFSGQQVRFLFRPTKIYKGILQKSLAPKFLRNGVDWSIELDILSRAFLTTQEQPKNWPILRAELRAMEQLDIPYFGAYPNSDRLVVGLEVAIAHYFTEPSYNQVLTRLQRLGETDLALQTAIIQQAFYAKAARTIETKQLSVPNTSTDLDADLSQTSFLTCEQLLQKASQIALEIQQAAIVGADGSAKWISLSHAPDSDQFLFQPLDDSLYNGSCGIALFLAALDYVRGSTQFHNLALGALQNLRKVLQASDVELKQKWARRRGISGATGLGSIIYSLVRTSQFLQDSALLEDAQVAANLVTSDAIAADQQLDILGGAAGAILGLLALYNQTGEPTILDRAVACGQHLVENRISIDNSPRAWKTIAQKPLTGFSHGAAGIAYSLLQLYRVTQDSAYKDAAGEGIAYERSVFSEAAANWSDFRSSAPQNGQPGFMVSWCHGAAGIGLARLGGLSIYQRQEIDRDVEVALQTTQKYGLQGVDYLCCGNFGRIEVLLVAAEKLSRPQLREIAQKQAAWVVARAEKKGTYQLFPNLSNYVFSPSFFAGNAGIGYQLLRLAYPNALPSALLWE